MANLTTEIVKRMLKAGKGASEIARRFRVTRQAVYHHINKLKRKRKKSKFTKPRRNYNSLIDWRIYNEGLVKRGEILLDFGLFDDWQDELASMNRWKLGRPYEYPDGFIWLLLRLKSSFKIDYRTLEGVARKLVVFISPDLKAPDYSTLQVRFTKLDCRLEVHEVEEDQEIAGDSTGLKTSNRGEYRMSKYRGKRRKFVKLHIAVNTKTRQVVSCSVTEEEVCDNKEMPRMIFEAQRYGKITRGLFDKGYDSKDNHWFLREEGIKGGIKPRETMVLERVKQEIMRERERIRAIKDLKKREVRRKRLLRLKILKQYLQDKEGWKERNRYGERWKAEGRYSVFKRIFGEHVFSKKMGNIKSEVLLKVNLINQFVSLTNGAIKAKSVCGVN